MSDAKPAKLHAALKAMNVGDRRFFKRLRPEDVAFAVTKFNCHHGNDIRVTCEVVEGNESIGVEPAIVIRRVS